MTYTFDNLKDDVRKEAQALRVHATAKELKKLDFESLDPEDICDCIYGQMTGDCYSERACMLIGKCTPRYVKDTDLISIKHDGFERIAKRINGTHVDNLHENRNQFDVPIHFSAIEAYILLPEARNANLIAFLRGESETLEL